MDTITSNDTAMPDGTALGIYNASTGKRKTLVKVIQGGRTVFTVRPLTKWEWVKVIVRHPIREFREGTFHDFLEGAVKYL